MEKNKLCEDRKRLLEKMSEYERLGKFNDDVENDPPAKELKPEMVDYLAKKFSTRLKTKTANFLGDRFFLGLIKKGRLIVEKVEGIEHLLALEKGCIITSNHFSFLDNYIVFHALRSYLPRRYLYKIIREGNYTNFPGLRGFLFKYCNTLPLSRNRRTMMNFTSATQTLLKRGESILIYPEQSMWWTYKKPRPFKIGGFKIAYKANVPVLPVFISMQDGEGVDEYGYPVQRHTVHILPPVYPNSTLGEKLGATKMLEETYALYKEKYESVYGKELVFDTENEKRVDLP